MSSLPITIIHTRRHYEQSGIRIIAKGNCVVSFIYNKEEIMQEQEFYKTINSVMEELRENSFGVRILYDMCSDKMHPWGA